MSPARPDSLFSRENPGASGHLLYLSLEPPFGSDAGKNFEGGLGTGRALRPLESCRDPS